MTDHPIEQRDEGIDHWWAAGPMSTGTNLFVFRPDAEIIPASLALFLFSVAHLGHTVGMVDLRDRNLDFRLNLLVRLNPDLLLLENLDVELPDDPVVEQSFDALINQRYEQLRPTIVTTTIQGEEIRRRLGDRAASRLFQSYEVTVIRGGMTFDEWRNV